MLYQFIRKKSYWLYSPREAVRQLYYFAEIRRDSGTRISISKSEYRKFMRHNKVSINLKRILHYYYSHKIKRVQRLNKSKGVSLKAFGEFGVNSNFESKSFSDLSRIEQIELALDKLKIEGKKPSPETARFVLIKCSFGLFWVSLKKNGYKRLIMHSFTDLHIEQIKREIEDLISSQINKREKLIKEI